MASLRFKHGLRAGLCARGASLCRQRAVDTAPFSAIAGVVDSNASLAGTKLREKWEGGLVGQQQQRHLSAAFDYKPLFQYGATPRDDPTEVRKPMREVKTGSSLLV